MPEPSRYRFGPLERRGLVAGWRGGQIVSVALGVMLAVAALRSRPSVPSITLALAALCGGIFLATWPMHGRTGEEWLPTVARWSLDSMSGRRRRLAALPGLGHRVAAGEVEDAPVERSQRGPFAGLEVLAVGLPGVEATSHGAMAGAARPATSTSGRSATIGVIHDARRRTYTAVLALRGHSFALLGPTEKDRRVAGWAAVLGSLARERSGIHRIEWLASTVPDDGRAVRAFLGDRSAVPEHHPARRSYAGLLDEIGASASRHDVHLAVQVRAGRARSSGRGRGRRSDGLVSSCAALLAEIRLLCRRLEEADVSVEGVLTPARVAQLLRRPSLSDPASSSTVPTPSFGPAAAPTTASMTSERWPWPLCVDSSWASIRTDATISATYWIAEWPRVDVGPDFLGPLLLGPVRRTLAVVMEPLSPSEATRKVEQARTADLADAELRRRGGFLSTARRERESALVARRESELADGHASFRFSGYVTVTAESEAQLVEACEATEQAASQARLELRRLFGQQEQAFTYTLPLARGLS